jgi:hypothetical protein
MSNGSFDSFDGDGDGETPVRMCLHPSVGTIVRPGAMTPRQKVAAIAKLRCLEHDLFDGEQVRRDLSRVAAEEIVARLNELRQALGWLEIDLDGHWRWPHHSDPAPVEPAAGVAGIAS